LWGRLFAFFLYDKKYLHSKYFKSKFNNICAIGWRWTINDFKGRFILGINKRVKWPVSPRTTIGNVSNIIFDADDLHIFQVPGTYFQGMGAKILIGKGTYIAPNVGLITANHSFSDLDSHETGKDIIIGEKSWIGMNSMILPGVCLGEQTIVGAGSVVTKSFLQGHCVIAGNPAKVIKEI